MTSMLMLLPGLAAQFVLGFVLIGLFVQSGDGVPFWKPVLTSLIMVVIGTLMGIFLTPYLYQGTIVMQWFMFVLLGKVLCSMPLDKSMMAQFCFFSWMLGLGMVEERFSASDPAEETEAVPEWMVTTRKALLPDSMLLARDAALSAMYDLPEEERPEQEPVVAVQQPNPPSSRPTARPALSQNAGSDRMTGAEFEALFYDTARPASELVPVMGTAEDPTLRLPEHELLLGEVEELTPPTTIDPDTSEEIVQVKNRSTDPDFLPPAFMIGAVSSGKRGKFAMVDGRLLREGAILRTGTSQPRGWKLHLITETDLFWQPLK
jgi:hypothetical protein